MAKRIELTWKHQNGNIFTEKCWLCEEDDQFIINDDTPVTVICENGISNTVGSLMKSQVLFEDEHGIFCVSPENVINIKEL